jgi:E3 ubiquitin-protein ligase HUWE1
MQIVQELFNRTGLGNGLMTADVQLEVPSGIQGGSAMLIDQALQQYGVGCGATSSIRVRDLHTSDPRGEAPDFTALQTLQRWTEEAKLSHGKHL